MKEKTLETQLVFDGYFLKVVRDRVETPNGHETTREYIQHPGAACIIPLKDDGTLIMEKQYRHPLKMTFLEFPAGKMDPGESSLQTAMRELTEETGYSAGKWTFLTSIHPVIGYSDERIDIFLAQDLKLGVAKLDQDETLETVELNLKDLLKKVYEGEVTDVKTQIAAFWLEKIIKKEWSK